MKLRNKKTGEIKEWQRVGAIVYGEMNEVYDSAEYNSLAELNEDWEDYKPAEPYIEDEKIRKFVRDWATFNKILKACIQKPDGKDYWYKVLGNDKEAKRAWAIYIHASYSETVSKDYNCDGPMIPIAELCGEEQECEN
jgi:hypothetical protein